MLGIPNWKETWLQIKKKTVKGKDRKTHSIHIEVFWKKLVVPGQLCLKFGANIKEMKYFKKEIIEVDVERHQSVKTEKQYALKIEDVW